MILKALFIQRICSYDGEFAPEALCCITEYAYYDYPKWFDMEVKNQLIELKDGISSHAVIDIEVDQDKIANILNNNPKVQGEIK